MNRVLVGKPEGKRPLGRPRRRWENNIKTDLQEVGGGRVAGTCGYSEELLGSINAGNFLSRGKVYWLASQEGLCSME